MNCVRQPQTCGGCLVVFRQSNARGYAQGSIRIVCVSCTFLVYVLDRNRLCEFDSMSSHKLRDVASHELGSSSKPANRADSLAVNVMRHSRKPRRLRPVSTGQLD